MKVMSGTKMLEIFGGLSESMKSLQQMSDGQFHLKVTWQFQTFEQSGNPNEVLPAFAKWLEKLVETEATERFNPRREREL
jgi:hypothetical protein